MDIINKIKTKHKVYHLSGCTVEEVIEAEKVLQLSFSEEYRNYLMNYGAISFGSHEFTGLGGDEHIDVVFITQEEKKLNPNIPNDCIVIENLGIEGIIILQDSNGEIYCLDQNSNLEKVSHSFSAYINSLV